MNNGAGEAHRAIEENDFAEPKMVRKPYYHEIGNVLRHYLKVSCRASDDHGEKYHYRLVGMSIHAVSQQHRQLVLPRKPAGKNQSGDWSNCLERTVGRYRAPHYAGRKARKTHIFIQRVEAAFFVDSRRSF